MKLLTYRVEDDVRFGVLRDDGLVDISTRLEGLDSIRTVLENAALAAVADAAATAETADRKLEDVELLPVVPNPGKILCAGVNYRAHRDEAGRSEATHPTIFTRFADSQIGHNAPALRPPASDRFDYEGELAVVIGKAGAAIAPEDAMAHVAGYACYNDFSVRDWQRHTTQWTPGKNFPGTGAFGPQLVTADEVASLDVLKIQTRVNGDVRQSATIADLIFSVPALVGYISTFTPLAPGDVIVTGTPGGVGMFREPPEFLHDGDLVEVEIDGIGLLVNKVVVA
ncbi:fumarylacetoacetate hydrolase family protein [Streptomyces sp. NPDC005728]|uniref:fumarylacetoacetate hydrolase family protein n=1 Tax=Streptomyces sp. NPDC005728 TaxID=3157054 RepID=UPI0033F29375